MDEFAGGFYDEEKNAEWGAVGGAQGPLNPVASLTAEGPEPADPGSPDERVGHVARAQVQPHPGAGYDVCAVPGKSRLGRRVCRTLRAYIIYHI